MPKTYCRQQALYAPPVQRANRATLTGIFMLAQNFKIEWIDGRSVRHL
ncbi:MAG: hypothetical protein ACE5E7_09215 [Anaerolineae bacterium]